MSKASKKLLRQQRLIAQIKQEPGRGRWVNAKELEEIESYLRSCITADTVIRTLIAIANVIYYDWSKVQKKETRLKNFFLLATKYLETVDNPTERMQELEKTIHKEVGFKFERLEIHHD